MSYRKKKEEPSNINNKCLWLENTYEESLYLNNDG